MSAAHKHSDCVSAQAGRDIRDAGTRRRRSSSPRWSRLWISAATPWPSRTSGPAQASGQQHAQLGTQSADACAPSWPPAGWRRASPAGGGPGRPGTRCVAAWARCGPSCGGAAQAARQHAGQGTARVQRARQCRWQRGVASAAAFHAPWAPCARGRRRRRRRPAAAHGGSAVRGGAAAAQRTLMSTGGNATISLAAGFSLWRSMVTSPSVMPRSPRRRERTLSLRGRRQRTGAHGGACAEAHAERTPVRTSSAPPAP